MFDSNDFLLDSRSYFCYGRIAGVYDMQTRKQQIFCGRGFTGEEISLIQEIVGTCGGISRRELAHTVCELLEWKRPNNRLKARECSDLLELLEAKGALTLPEKRRKGKNGSQKIVPGFSCRRPDSTLIGSLWLFIQLIYSLR